MGGCVCHVVVSGSQVVDQGAGARGTSAAGGPVSHVQLPLQPSFLCCRHCHGQGSPSHVSASPATSGFSGAAVSAAMVGRPGLQAPTPLVPRFCLFSVLQSNHLFFFFFFFFILNVRARGNTRNHARQLPVCGTIHTAQETGIPGSHSLNANRLFPSHLDKNVLECLQNALPHLLVSPFE